MGTDKHPSNDDQDLAQIEAITARIGAIVTALSQVRTDITELRGFLTACGYGLNQADLARIESRVEAMAGELTLMSKEY